MKKQIVLIMLLALGIFVNAQTISDVFSDNSLNYYQIINQIEKNNLQVYKNSSDWELKRYSRWCAYWDSRVDASGNFSAYTEAWQNYYINGGNSQTRSANPLTMSWELAGPFEMSDPKNYMGRCQSVAVDPIDNNIVYLGSMSGGLWKTTNALISNPSDVNWECITKDYSGIGAFDIAINPTNNNTIFFITSFYANNISNNRTFSSGILKSTDGGQNWQWSLVLNPSEEVMLTRIIYDPNDNNIMYALADKRLYKSIDGGENWIYNEITNASQLWEIAINPNNTSEMILSGKNCIFKSSDGGQSFEDIEANLIGEGNNSPYIVVDYNIVDNYYYALAYTKGLKKSIDGYRSDFPYSFFTNLNT